MERTTDLQELKLGKPFTWGEVIRFHSIGEYDIVEFYEWKTEGCRVLSGEADESHTSFQGYLNGKDTSTYWMSLDEALAGLIAYKREGPNHRADGYFMKMLATE